MEIQRRHWAVALTAAAFLHAGALAGLAGQTPEPVDGIPGPGGIALALGPAGGVADPVVEPDPEPEPEPIVEPEPEPEPEPIVEPDPEPEPEPIVEPEPEPEPEPIVEPDPEPEPEPIVEPEPEPEPEPQVLDQPPPPPVRPVVPKRPRPVRVVQPRTPVPVQPAPVQTAAVTSAPAVSAPAMAGGAAAPAVREGGGDPAARDTYIGRLRAWLERHKTYPRSAQRRRMEGTVLLYFVMDRTGRVLSYRVQRSSGYSPLDEAVRDMIVRAQPLPAIPDTVSGNRLELVVPIRFELR